MGEQSRLRKVLGRHDCGLICANWVLRVTGRDPAAEFRGCYHDEASLAAIAPGGLPDLFERVFSARAGLAQTNAPQLGDIALILPVDNTPRGAIRTESGYVTVASHGLWGIRLNVPLLAAWEI